MCSRFFRLSLLCLLGSPFLATCAPALAGPPDSEEATPFDGLGVHATASILLPLDALALDKDATAGSTFEKDTTAGSTFEKDTTAGSTFDKDSTVAQAVLDTLQGDASAIERVALTSADQLNLKLRLRDTVPVYKPLKFVPV
jgi:hypothetical protein